MWNSSKSWHLKHLSFESSIVWRKETWRGKHTTDLNPDAPYFSPCNRWLFKTTSSTLFICRSKLSISTLHVIEGKIMKLQNMIFCPLKMRALLDMIKASTKTCNLITKRTTELMCNKWYNKDSTKTTSADPESKFSRWCQPRLHLREMPN